MSITSKFLMNGSSDDLANISLTDKELLNQFKAIENMQENDKSVIKILIDAFITKKKIQQLAI
jgi:hypothetical protein